MIDDAADDSVDDMNRNQYADQIEKGRNVMLKEKETNVQVCIQNLSLFLDDFKDGKIGKEDISKVIATTILQSIEEIQKKRVEILKAMFQSPEEDEISVGQDEELITDVDEKLRTVPGLTHLGIPLQRNILRVIVRELSVLSNKFPKEGILNYSSFGGVEHSLLQLPVCASKKSFIRMN